MKKRDGLLEILQNEQRDLVHLQVYLQRLEDLCAKEPNERHIALYVTGLSIPLYLAITKEARATSFTLTYEKHVG